MRMLQRRRGEGIRFEFDWRPAGAIIQPVDCPSVVSAPSGHAQRLQNAQREYIMHLFANVFRLNEGSRSLAKVAKCSLAFCAEPNAAAPHGGPLASPHGCRHRAGQACCRRVGGGGCGVAAGRLRASATISRLD